ncbi:MAG: hypothetical protein K2R98_04360 [Gemmataceae bacterium]|nr:hypothetical protein [Gemmataceae bacterium]
MDIVSPTTPAPASQSDMGRKRDLKRVDRVAREAGIPPEERRDFGRYVERCKRDGAYGSPPDGDATEDELRMMAEEFKRGIR